MIEVNLAFDTIKNKENCKNFLNAKKSSHDWVLEFDIRIKLIGHSIKENKIKQSIYLQFCELD